ncbi:unnamed protein product [Prunus armeniaca]
MEAFKYEIAANAYKLGYLDCMNGSHPCCLLRHEDEAVEEQVASEAVMEEDNAKGVAAEEARADAEEQVVGDVEQIVPVEQNEVVVNAVDQKVAELMIGSCQLGSSLICIKSGCSAFSKLGWPRCSTSIERLNWVSSADPRLANASLHVFFGRGTCWMVKVGNAFNSSWTLSMCKIILSSFAKRKAANNASYSASLFEARKPSVKA